MLDFAVERPLWVKSGGRRIADAKSGLPSIPDQPQATKLVGLGPKGDSQFDLQLGDELEVLA